MQLVALACPGVFNRCYSPLFLALWEERLGMWIRSEPRPRSTGRGAEEGSEEERGDLEGWVAGFLQMSMGKGQST